SPSRPAPPGPRGSSASWRRRDAPGGPTSPPAPPDGGSARGSTPPRRSRGRSGPAAVRRSCAPPAGTRAGAAESARDPDHALGVPRPRVAAVDDPPPAGRADAGAELRVLGQPVERRLEGGVVVRREEEGRLAVGDHLLEVLLARRDHRQPAREVLEQL